MDPRPAESLQHPSAYLMIGRMEIVTIILMLILDCFFSRVPATWIDKFDFLRAYPTAYLEVLKPLNIQNGFMGAGIYPLSSRVCLRGSISVYQP